MIKSRDALTSFLTMIANKPNIAAAARALGAHETTPYTNARRY
jgi:hypothetical protein